MLTSVVRINEQTADGRAPIRTSSAAQIADELSDLRCAVGEVLASGDVAKPKRVAPVLLLIAY
jgi:hypothetical protein